MSGNRTGDFFGLPPMNLNGVTEEEMMEMLDRYTNHEEVTIALYPKEKALYL